MMQLNYVKSRVLWKRQCQEFAVVFLERDDVQIPGAAWLGSLSGYTLELGTYSSLSQPDGL